MRSRGRRRKRSGRKRKRRRGRSSRARRRRRGRRRIRLSDFNFKSKKMRKTILHKAAEMGLTRVVLELSGRDAFSMQKGQAGRKRDYGLALRD